MNQDAFRKMLTVGVDDGSFQKGITRKALLAVVLLRGVEIRNVGVTEVTVDGLDATRKLSEILREWEFAVALLAGVSFAGFNVIDPTVIYEKFGKPIIVISKTRPDNKAVKSALQRHFEDWKIRWEVFEKLDSVRKISVLAGKPVYIEIVGIGVRLAANVIRALSFYGRVPEPIRVARLVARGLS